MSTIVSVAASISVQYAKDIKSEEDAYLGSDEPLTLAFFQFTGIIDATADDPGCLKHISLVDEPQGTIMACEEPTYQLCQNQPGVMNSNDPTTSELPAVAHKGSTMVSTRRDTTEPDSLLLQSVYPGPWWIWTKDEPHDGSLATVDCLPGHYTENGFGQCIDGYDAKGFGQCFDDYDASISLNTNGRLHPVSVNTCATTTSSNKRLRMTGRKKKHRVSPHDEPSARDADNDCRPPVLRPSAGADISPPTVRTSVGIGASPVIRTATPSVINTSPSSTFHSSCGGEVEHVSPSGGIRCLNVEAKTVPMPYEEDDYDPLTELRLNQKGEEKVRLPKECKGCLLHVRAAGRPEKFDQSDRLKLCRYRGCGKRFACATDARACEKAHVMTLHKATPKFICRIGDCSEMMKDSNKMKRHFSKAHDLRTYFCSSCDNRFLDGYKRDAHRNAALSKWQALVEKIGFAEAAAAARDPNWVQPKELKLRTAKFRQQRDSKSAAPEKRLGKKAQSDTDETDDDESIEVHTVDHFPAHRIKRIKCFSAFPQDDDE